MKGGKSIIRSAHSLKTLVWLLIFLIGGRLVAVDTIRCQLADGFDFPVGKPNGDNYYKFRGYHANGHMGEDWNGRGGGDSDLGAPIYATARGVVVISENIGAGWGNCIVVRHAYRDETGKIAMVDSQYGHLHQRIGRVGQIVEKGQLIGAMGSNNGMYAVHLHFEMRKNLHIGMNRSQFARDDTNYYSPTDFINKHRVLQSSPQKYPIPTGLFAPYGRSLADARIDTGSAVQVPVLPSIKPDSALPAAGPADDDEDFWTKLRARLKQGKVIDSNQP